MKRIATRPVVSELLCLTTSYPHGLQRSAGGFVRRLNQITQQALTSTTGAALTLDVVTMWRGSELATDEEFLEVMQYTHPLGDMFERGAPDWVSAHPIVKLLAMPINGMRLRAAYHRARESSPSALTLAHWAVPCGWIATSRVRSVLASSTMISSSTQLGMPASVTGNRRSS